MYWTFPTFFPIFSPYCIPEAPSNVKIEESAEKLPAIENEKTGKDENKEKLKEYLIQELSQKS